MKPTLFQSSPAPLEPVGQMQPGKIATSLAGVQQSLKCLDNNELQALLFDALQRLMAHQQEGQRPVLVADPDRRSQGFVVFQTTTGTPRHGLQADMKTTFTQPDFAKEAREKIADLCRATDSELTSALRTFAQWLDTVDFSENAKPTVHCMENPIAR